MPRLPRVACNVARSRRCLGAPLLAWAILTVGVAEAEEVSSDASARASALFSEGAKLLDEGDAAQACPKLEAAVTLTRRSALGGMLTLAECYERIGRIASAWGLYDEVATKADAAGQQERAGEAKLRGAALAPRVPRLILQAPPELGRVDGASIWINALEQPRSGIESSIPVDLGKLEIEVRAPNRAASRVVVDVVEGQAEVRVLLPIPVEERPPPSVSPRESSSFWSTGRFIGLGVAGLGTGVAVAGLAVAAVAAGDYDTGLRAGGCVGSPPVCEDVGPIDEARTLGDVATALVIGGAVVGATGLVVFAVAGDEEPGSPVVSLRVNPRGLAVEVSRW